MRGLSVIGLKHLLGDIAFGARINSIRIRPALTHLPTRFEEECDDALFLDALEYLIVKGGTRSVIIAAPSVHPGWSQLPSKFQCLSPVGRDSTKRSWQNSCDPTGT